MTLLCKNWNGSTKRSAAILFALLSGTAHAQTQSGEAYVQSLVDQYDALRADHPEVIAANRQKVIDIMAAASPERRRAAIADNTTYDMVGMMRAAQGGLNASVFGPFAGENNNPFMHRGSASPSSLANYGKDRSNSPRPCNTGIQPLVGCSGSSSFPSGHTTNGTGASLLAAYIFPERFQSFITRGQNYGESRIVVGLHYPLDVMASRGISYKAVADLLAAGVGEAYVTPTRVSQAAQCGSKTILACANSRPDSAYSDWRSNKDYYEKTKYYGFSSIGPTDKPMVVPDNAEYLIKTRFPYLTNAQLREIIRTTADPSGGVLDDPWSRINLFAAADGYGAFDTDVTVRMDATLAGNKTVPGSDFQAADMWRNDIAGKGSLTKTGSGVLTLAGNNSFSGFNLTEGGLTLTGLNRLTGSSTVTGGVLAISGASLNIASDLSIEKTGVLQLDHASVAVGRTLRIDGGVDLRGPGEFRLGATAMGVVNGTVSGQGSLTKAGAGLLTLAGTNTFSDGVTLAGGSLSVSREANLGALSGGLIFDGGILQVTGTSFTATQRAITWGGRGGGFDITNPANTFTVTQSLSGPGGLDKAGAGTLTLTGTNTYTGGTAILAGTLQIGAGGTTGAILGDVANAGTLAFNRADDIAFPGTVSGPGDLRQLGPGTLTFTGPQTYTGLTTVAAGTLALTPSASLVSPVLTLAGASLTNAGSLTGGLVNAGTTLTSGTIAGGVTNTGTLTASAGQINGAIRNQAGLFSVTGPVSSDATFANAAAATLSVSGSYSLAGLLTNAGTLTVAGGGRLTAGSVDNAGVLTVAANASVVDTLTNTGFVSNAGTYTADASNAAGATLINTGTFSTVSQPFANAGSLVTTGVLNGGLANAGFVQAAGQINGAVANTGAIQFAGVTTGITRLTNDGSVDLGGTALSVGSLAGGTATAILGNGRLTAGADDSSTTYAGRIVDGGSATALTKVGAGVLTLSGDSAFTGPLTVSGGEVSVTGTLTGAPVTLGSGTLLSGQATLASLTLGSGSAVAPGVGAGGIGRIAVAGPLAFAPGSIYRVDATADGRADRIDVGGRASLTGGAVQAVAGTGQYAPRTRYTILTAAGGLDGQFAGVTSNFAFLTPFLGYDAYDVYLTLARNDLDFAAVAQTRNQRAAAAAVQAGAVGSPLYDAAATLSAPQARAAFAALSGDAHASLVSTAFATAGLLREAVLDRLRWDGASGPDSLDYGSLPAAYTADRAGQPVAGALAPLVPMRVIDPRVFALWGQGFGSTGSVRTDGNAASLSRTTGGFVLGADIRLDGGLRLGLAGGYRTTSFATPGTAESGAVDGVFGGLYGDYRAGPISVRVGALAADDAVSLRRLVLFPGFTGTPSARTGGTTLQGFGEVGYRVGLGADLGGTAAMLEPFVGGAVVAIRRDRFAEQGGPAALGGARQDDTIPVSTLGVRGEAALDFGFGVRVLAHGLLGYRHAYGDVTPATRLTVLGTGASFASAGLPIDRDALVAEAGLSAQVAPNTTLGVSYTGQVGQRAQDHAAKGNFIVHF